MPAPKHFKDAPDYQLLGTPRRWRYAPKWHEDIRLPEIRTLFGMPTLVIGSAVGGGDVLYQRGRAYCLFGHPRRWRLVSKRYRME